MTIKHLYICAALIVFASILASCDGRQKAYISPKESLEQNKLLDSFSENIAYLPETYNEIATDTLLSNGFRVKTKFYTDMDRHVLHTFTKDTIQYKQYYRDIVSNIEVFKNSTQILNLQVDKAFIKSHKLNVDNLESMVLKSVWLSEYNSLKTNNVIVMGSICMPETEDCIVFEIIIDEQGNYNVYEVKPKEYS